jgi:hypothetical protein
MIKKISLVTVFLMSTSMVTIAQNSNSNEGNSVTDTTKKSVNKIQVSKRVDKNTATITGESTSPVVTPASTIDVSKRTNGTVSGNQNSTSTLPKPATKSTSEVTVSSAKYVPNTSISTLDNLLEMIELKDNVNDSPNSATLKTSADYAELQSNINTYRSNFENHINSQGFENCSTREQNYYLSFLKDENRMEEYNLCLSKLNN